MLRGENRELRRRMAKMQLDKELEENGRELTGAELKRVRHCPVDLITCDNIAI